MVLFRFLFEAISEAWWKYSQINEQEENVIDGGNEIYYFHSILLLWISWWDKKQ